MKNKFAKKAHTKMTKYMRAVNRGIYNDPLWLGRFYVREHYIDSIWNFEDKSGCILRICYEYVDKKTGRVGIRYFNNYDYYHMGYEMNNFIVEECKVWDENPRPSINRVEDFRK